MLAAAVDDTRAELHVAQGFAKARDASAKAKAILVKARKMDEYR